MRQCSEKRVGLKGSVERRQGGALRQSNERKRAGLPRQCSEKWVGL